MSKKVFKYIPLKAIDEEEENESKKCHHLSEIFLSVQKLKEFNR